MAAVDNVNIKNHTPGWEEVKIAESLNLLVCCKLKWPVQNAASIQQQIKITDGIQKQGSKSSFGNIKR